MGAGDIGLTCVDGWPGRGAREGVSGGAGLGVVSTGRTDAATVPFIVGSGSEATCPAAFFGDSSTPVSTADSARANPAHDGYRSSGRALI